MTGGDRVSSEVGELFVTLRALTEPWTTGWTEAATLAEESTGKIDAAGLQMASSLDQSATASATAFRAILDAAVQLAEGIVEPLNTVKTSVRSVASAIRALAKAATGLSTTAPPAFEEVTAAAAQMATGMDASLATSRAAFAGLGGEFVAASTEARAAATQITASSEAAAAAATEAGGAAAASAERSSLAMTGTGSSLMKYATGLGATAFGVFEAVKGATNFNTEMTRLNTLASVSKSQLGTLGSGVLELAGQVGENPDSLAEALYHVESSFASTGITSANAMKIMKTAAEGAQIGGADLVDVQNALDAAVVSGLPGVENYSQAMGALNAIVGAGDMTMQDLANAMGTGVLAVVKGYGLTLNDVGAALATFGDNNIRGATAATDLRMSVQALAVPAKDGKLQLEAWGQSANSLSVDMQQHGLVYTLNKLHDLFIKNGVTATTQGAVITDMFGKKAGAGLAVLMGQLDRVNSKVPDIAKGAGGFAASWQTASHTIGQEFKDMKAGLESLGVKIGTMLLPPLSKFLGWVRDGITWVTSHKQAVSVLASVLGGVLVAAIFAVGTAITAALPEVSLVSLAIVGIASAVIYAWTHFKPFREVITTIGNALRTILVGALHLAQAAIHELISWFESHKQIFLNAWSTVLKAVHTVVKWFDDNVLTWIRARVADLVAWWGEHSAQLEQVWSKIWELISLDAKIAWDVVIHPMLVMLQAMWKLVWMAVWDTIKIVWSAVSGIITTAMHLIMNIIGLILDIITGKWGKVWGDLKHLVSQAFHDIVSTIGNLVSGFGTLLWDAGANIIKGLISGIKSMIGGISNVMGGIGHEIRSFLPFSPAKQGPLSGSGSPDIAGAKIGEMVATGISGSVRKVAQAGRGLAGAAALAIGGSGGIGSLAITANGAFGAAATNAAASNSLPPIVVNVDGRKLFEILQPQILRNGRRNPTTGVTY